MSMVSQKGRHIAAAVFAGALMSLAAAPLAQAQVFSLTTEEQVQETQLASKAMDAIKALPPGSNSSGFEVAILESTQGYSPTVIEAAMAQIAGTPGIPTAAVEAARRIGRVFASLYYHDGSGPGGFFGFGGTPGLDQPAFLSGGGGGTSTSYTQ